MSKKIYIVAWKTGENSIGITAPYYEFFSHFGNVHILSPQQDIADDANLVVIPGGADVNPLRYGQMPGINTSNPDIFKEFFDVQRLPAYIEKKIPVMGVCRGIQSLAVHFGGTLHQDIFHDYSTKSRDELVHSVFVVKDGKLSTKFKVNSLHHQAIDVLPDCFRVLLLSDGAPEYQYVEAIKHKELPIVGVQYHPKIWGLAA